MWEKVFFTIGATFMILGLSGMAGACEGQGSFLLSALFLAAGIGLCNGGIKEP